MNDSLLSKVRLSAEELLAIQQSFKQFFSPEDRLWLFGSRAKKNTRGGDIDLYIECNAENYDVAKTIEDQFIYSLWSKIGEQKIDVVLNVTSVQPKLSIYEIAKKSGVRLV